MAVATGTALLIGAAVSAGAQAYRAKKSGDATDRQMDASAEALDYQKLEREREQRQWAQTWDNWNRRRSALMDRYGIPRLDDTNPFHDPAPAGAQVRPGANIPNARVARGVPPGVNLGDLIQPTVSQPDLYRPEWEVS